MSKQEHIERICKLLWKIEDIEEIQRVYNFVHRLFIQADDTEDN